MAVDLNYGIGVEGKNLVLKTLGRVYVKVKDRKYELLFRPEDLQNLIKEGNTNSEDLTNGTSVYFINSALDLSNLEYPGDGCLIVSKDGSFYFTEKGSYTQIPLAFNVDELTLTRLNVSDQIVFTGSNPPFVIPNSIFIQNLNADKVDGYDASAFGIKNNSENITGVWTFNNVKLKNVTSSGVFKNIDESIYIDFQTGTITCKEIIADNLNKQEEDPIYNLVSGIGNEVWVGSEIDILTSNEYVYTPVDNTVGLMQSAYDQNYLPSNPADNIEWTLEDFWIPLFFTTYNEDSETFILKDFSNQSVLDEINAKLSPYYTINNFFPLIWALQTGDISNFTGTDYQLTIYDSVLFQLVLPNMIVKDNFGNIGVVLSRDNDIVIVRMLNENNNITGNKLISIGFITHPSGICLRSDNPSLSILKNVLNQNDISIYFGELSKVDQNKSGIGMILNGSIPANKVADNQLESLRNYTHTSEINIGNPYIKWQQVNELNEDGSGYLSKGQIRWSSNNDLVVDGSDVINSRIDNTGITNSSFQSGSVIINTDGSGSIGDKIEFNTTTVTKNTPMGPADGDLSGDYPNPTIRDGVITSNKLANNAVTTDKIANGAVTEAKLDSAIINRLNTIETDVDNLQSDVTTIKEDIVEINNDIDGIQTQLDQIDQKIQEQLEPLIQDVENLKTTVSEQGDSISSLSTSLNNLSDTVTSHGQSIISINESITTLTDSIDGVDTDLTALTTRVATLESTVGTLNTMLENRLNGN